MSIVTSRARSIVSRVLIVVLAVTILSFLLWFFRASNNNVGSEFVVSNKEKTVSPSINNGSDRPIPESSLGVSVEVNPVVYVKIKEKKASNEPFSFDVGLVFDALSQVVVDHNDDVVINHNAKDLLESAFKKMTFDLSENDLNELNELIVIGLPGKAGEQTAKIVRDYYDYRLAEADFMASTYGEDMIDAQTNFEQIVAIRRAELGHEVAEKLFGLQEAEAHFMIQSIKNQSDTGLTEEERLRKQTDLQNRFEIRQKDYLEKYVR